MPSAQPVKMDKFDIEQAARTLVDAEMIRRNKPLHTAAVAHIKQKNAAEEAVISRK